MAADNKDQRTPRDELAERFIKILESDKTMEWFRGWKGGAGAPLNGLSGRKYTGINRFILYLRSETEGWSDPRFYPISSLKKTGYFVKKGEKSTHVELWKIFDRKTRKKIDFADRDRILRSITNPDERKEREKDFILSVQTLPVFNASQLNGVPELKEEREAEPSERIELAERTLESLRKNTGVEIRYKGNESYYSPKEDRIYLPERKRFYTDEDFYSTAFHEYGHSTGHRTRLNRQIENIFGSELYSIEELRAEIASTFVCGDLGIRMSEEHLDNHEAYVRSWLSAIKQDHKVLFDAIKDAEKISDYIEDKGEVALHRTALQGKIPEAAEKPETDQKEETENWPAPKAVMSV